MIFAFIVFENDYIYKRYYPLLPGKSEPFGQHDIIGCALNRETEEISFYKNGKDLGIAFSIRALHSGKFLILSIIKLDMQFSVMKPR